MIEFVRSRPWIQIFQYMYKRPDDINPGEGRTYGSLVRWLAWWFPNSRTAVWLDSRVTLGGVGKGRSPTPRLNRVHLRTLPTTLGGASTQGRTIRAPNTTLPIRPPGS